MDQSDDGYPVVRAALGFSRALRQRHAAALADLGLHPGQDLLLAEVWRRPGIRLSTLAASLGVEPPTVTRMVARLERGGLLERRPDPDDGRAALLFATPRSRLLEAGVRRAWEAVEEELVGALQPAEVEPLVRRLRALSEGVSRSRDS